MSAFPAGAASLLRVWRKRRALGRLGRSKARSGSLRAKVASQDFKRKYFGAGTKGRRYKNIAQFYYKEKKRQYGGAVGLGGSVGAYIGYKAGRRDRR